MWVIKDFNNSYLNALIHLARPIDIVDSLADNLMTSIFRLRFNNYAPFEKTDDVNDVNDVMIQGMSRDAWNEFFQNYFSEIYLIVSLWKPLFGFFCVMKKDFCILCGGLFSLSTHALLVWVNDLRVMSLSVASNSLRKQPKFFTWFYILYLKIDECS